MRCCHCDSGSPTEGPCHTFQVEFSEEQLLVLQRESKLASRQRLTDLGIGARTESVCFSRRKGGLRSQLAGQREGMRSICLSVESGSGVFYTHLRFPFARTFLPLLGTTASHVCVSVAPGAPRLLRRALPAPGFCDSLMGHTQTGRWAGWVPLPAGGRCGEGRSDLPRGSSKSPAGTEPRVPRAVAGSIAHLWAGFLCPPRLTPISPFPKIVSRIAASIKALPLREPCKAGDT